MKVLFRGIAMLCVLQWVFLSTPATAQERDSAKVGNHKVLYGLQVGFTLNTVDLYGATGGVARALKEGNHTIYAPGYHIATIGEVKLGRHFSLRAMPGVSLFKRDWEPTGMMLPAYLQADKYKMESVCGELPVDVKAAARLGNWEPYLTAGLSYRFDFASRRGDSDKDVIQPLNAHDLRFSFGFGVDWYTRYLKMGFEFKAGYGILPPHTEVGNHADPFFFHNGRSISIGVNIEGGK